MKNVDIRFLTFRIAVAGMLADINTGLAVICHTWVLHLNYIKLPIASLLLPHAKKKWTKKDPNYPFSLF